MDLDNRHLVHSEHAIVVEIRLHGAAVLERDLAEERGREPEGDGALDLRFHSQGVNDAPALERRDDAMHARRVAVQRHLGNLCADAAERLVHRDAARASFRQRASPARFRRGEIEHGSHARIRREELAAKL